MLDFRSAVTQTSWAWFIWSFPMHSTAPWQKSFCFNMLISVSLKKHTELCYTMKQIFFRFLGSAFIFPILRVRHIIPLHTHVPTPAISISEKSPVGCWSCKLRSPPDSSFSHIPQTQLSSEVLQSTCTSHPQSDPPRLYHRGRVRACPNRQIKYKTPSYFGISRAQWVSFGISRSQIWHGTYLC